MPSNKIKVLGATAGCVEITGAFVQILAGSGAQMCNRASETKLTPERPRLDAGSSKPQAVSDKGTGTTQGFFLPA